LELSTSALDLESNYIALVILDVPDLLTCADQIPAISLYMILGMRSLCSPLW